MSKAPTKSYPAEFKERAVILAEDDEHLQDFKDYME